MVDSIVKNTPSGVHKDFLSSELLAALKAVVEGQGPSMAKAVDKVLEMLGEWKAAFGDDTTYKNVKTTFNELEKGGYFIPEATLASASYMQKVKLTSYKLLLFYYIVICFSPFSLHLFKKRTSVSCVGKNLAKVLSKDG